MYLTLLLKQTFAMDWSNYAQTSLNNYSDDDSPINYEDGSNSDQDNLDLVENENIKNLKMGWGLVWVRKDKDAVPPESPTYSPQSPSIEDEKTRNDTGVPVTWAPKKSNHFVLPHPSKFPQPDFSDIPPPPKFRQNMNPIPNGTELSIIIPWAHRNTKEWYVGKILTDLQWGYVQGINMIHRSRNCIEHWKIFIHFSDLTEDGRKAKEHLMMETNKEIGIQHKYGIWKIRASTWNFDEEYRKSKNRPKVEFL